MEENGLPKIMDLPDVARYLKVHPSTIYRLLKKRELPAFRVGRDYKFNVEHIEQWMKLKEQERTNG